MKGAPRAAIRGLEPGDNALDARVAHHLVHVLRLREGATFVAFDPVTGDEGDATLRGGVGGVIGVDVVHASVGELRKSPKRPHTHVTLVQAIAKADKCDAVVRDATELGAAEIILVPTLRSVVKLNRERQQERLARWRRIAEEAARQCQRSSPPLVTFKESWRDALQSVSTTAHRFCLYEESLAPLGPPLLEALANFHPVAFAVGPEGGIDKTEIALAEQTGWVVASLGPIILRTETVAAALLGAVAVWSSAREQA